ncbi:unnamed protein product [Microthlaspi erraticum]|uniref:DUF8039 domain-containing protein n=1 Tax=Microthlaspi erraticum TaxID=1685480 RepID=A0A6D2KR66_9BRAS|nr:unnamed protein product [Microthlaspi erraticum]
MGRGMSISKLAFFQVKNKYVTEMKHTQVQLQHQVHELQEALARLGSNRSEAHVGENSAQRCASELKVAEGRILSTDHMDFINNIPLGPNSVKVIVETAVNGEAFMWRSALEMFTIAQAVGETIAWPQNCVVSLEDDLDP